MAACGIAARRKCEDIITSGKVTVNGKIVLVPQTMVELPMDKITVSGIPVTEKPELLYFMINKPRGYLCTSIEAAGERSVLTLFDDNPERLFTVGRLDLDTEGLLLVTNDGQFAQKVIHPSNNITKEYLVKTDKELLPEHLKAISAGCLVEGVWVKPELVEKVRKGTMKISVSEGKKREVRKLLENVGLEVLQLKRIRIGSLTLGSLPVGTYRPLKDKELSAFLKSQHETT